MTISAMHINVCAVSYFEIEDFCRGHANKDLKIPIMKSMPMREMPEQEVGSGVWEDPLQMGHSSPPDISPLNFGTEDKNSMHSLMAHASGHQMPRG